MARQWTLVGGDLNVSSSGLLLLVQRGHDHVRLLSRHDVVSERGTGPVWHVRGRGRRTVFVCHVRL